MSISVFKRTLAIFAAILLLAFLTLSPIAGLYGEHNHGCCPQDCLLCLVTSALAGFRISLRDMLCTAGILLFIYMCEEIRFGELPTALSSPVALKTKITS